MTAVPLFDAMALAAPHPSDRGSLAPTAELVAIGSSLVAGALADANRLFEYEAQSLARGWKDAEVHDRLTRVVYDLFDQWSSEAASVSDRVRPLAAGGESVGDVAGLEDAWWRVEARLKLTPEQMKRSTDQVRRGDVVSAEGLRDELRRRVPA